jgi:hypothetical protein
MSNSSTLVRIDNVILSYPRIVEPGFNNMSNKTQYSAVFLIPKSDTATVEKVQNAIAAAKATDRAVKAGIKPDSKNVKTTLHDGADKDDPRLTDYWVLNTTASNKPGVVYKDLSPVTSVDEAWAGQLVSAQVNMYAYNVSGNKGISAGLNNVMLYGTPSSGGVEGPLGRLDGRSSAAAAFSDIAEKPVVEEGSAEEAFSDFAV